MRTDLLCFVLVTLALPEVVNPLHNWDGMGNSYNSRTYGTTSPDIS